MSKLAEALRKKAQKVNDDNKQERIENHRRAVDHFKKIATTAAEDGKFEKKTSCLVHDSGKKYFCQTSNGGDGFDILNIERLISSLEDHGFKVDFKHNDRSYSRLDMKW